MSRLILIASGANEAGGLSIFDPSSPVAHAIRSLFILVLAVCGVILVVVEGVLIYSIIRFRRTSAETTEPPTGLRQHADRDRLDCRTALHVFRAVPYSHANGVSGAGRSQAPPAGSKPLYVTVIGHQWWWEYVYEKYDDQKLGFITANELHAPQARTEWRGRFT